MSKTHYIERPPRLQPDLPSGEYSIPDPPNPERNPNQPMIQVFLPMVTIIGYILMSIFGQGRNLLVMIPMAFSVVVTVSLAIRSRIRETRDRKAQDEAYSQRLIELRKEMTVKKDIQRRFYLHNYPSPDMALRIAFEASQGDANNGGFSRLGTRLWERRPNDIDFGDLRLGLGTRSSSVEYKLSKEINVDSPTVRDAKRLLEDSRVVNNVPVAIPLRNNREGLSDSDTSVHTIGVVGKNTKHVYAFMSALLVHYTSLHAPTDAHLYVLGSENTRDMWRWLIRLPHCSDGGSQEMLCFEDSSDRGGGKENSKVKHFLRDLRKVLEDRQLRLQDEKANPDVTLPFLLVVIDLLSTPRGDSMLVDLESDAAISLLIKEGQQLGASVFFLLPSLEKVPSGCQAIIELHSTPQNDGTNNQEKVNFRYAETGLNTTRYAGRADLITIPQALEQFSQYLSPLNLPKRYGADLVRSLLMLDMLDTHTSEELRQNIKDNWRRSREPEEADWLKSTLGMLAGGDYRTLKFSAAADGVHGLIAGSTGSGKSELLMTMILSLAYNYDPSIVNFVLVDFKGGAAFEPFRSLPHCVDIVTNLKGSAVERMFAAIMAEIHRREAINVATGSKHIVHYRKNGLHLPPYGRPLEVKGENQATAPYPHLFVFIDEFAEMIAENPEYKAQLNSITRLGRALGVTLILAAQRPTGVTDQMRANIKFRIALRVETREESSEVLRRPDAAYLPTGIPGRGYLQVGNENIELMQTAWTGSDFRGDRAVEKANVIWHDRPQNKGSNAEEDELPKVYEVMVDMMNNLAAEHSLPQQKPWPDFLPESITLQTEIDTSYLTPDGLNFILRNSSLEDVSSDNEDQSNGRVRETAPLNAMVTKWLLGEGQWPQNTQNAWTMRAVVGLIDNPYQAEQMPLMVDLRRGHAVVFGASGWGKTTFLRTLVSTLAVAQAPHELHVYFLDFGGRQLNVFRELPHTGAIITPDEGERVTRLLRQLDIQLERRKLLLSDAGADDLYSYNRQNPDDALPSILVVIDNFAEFRESFDGLLPLLTALVRESRAYGIHFAVSAELPNALSGKLYSLFTERFALRLSDPTEYTGIVGRGAHAVEEIPGRGFVRVGRRALEIQAALPVGELNETANSDETAKLAALLRTMKNADSYLSPEQLPMEIHTLPNRVLLSKLLVRKKGKRTHSKPFMAVDDLNLEPWSLDLTVQGPHSFVIGPPNSGKTTTMQSIVLSLATTYSPQEIMLVLIDFQRRFIHYGGKRTLEELPHVGAVLTSNEVLESFIENLQNECPLLSESQRRFYILIDNYESFVDEAQEIRGTLQKLGSLAREYGTDGLHFIIAGSNQITRSTENLRKQIQMPRLGIALQSEDAVSALNGRMPRGLKQVELPMGRGFVVKSGRTLMLQIATPFEDDEKQPQILDRWVGEIQKQYPKQRSAWSVLRDAQPGDSKSDHGEETKTQEDNPDDETEAIDIDALKNQLHERGLSETLTALMSAQDLINTAKKMGILTTEGEG
jgi:DNA segregation ATPase FtsK/SpoIIIE-like protein